MGGNLDSTIESYKKKQPIQMSANLDPVEKHVPWVRERSERSVALWMSVNTSEEWRLGESYIHGLVDSTAAWHNPQQQTTATATATATTATTTTATIRILNLLLILNFILGSCHQE